VFERSTSAPARASPWTLCRLFLDPAIDSPLSVHWTAAGLDAHGRNTGTIALTVVPSTLILLKGWRAELPDAAEPDD
jgi:hypothetical protein